MGALHGLLRIRGGTQDDSHIICTPDQLIEEILEVFDLTLEIHRTFGFSDPIVHLSTKPGVAIGEPEMWERATDALQHASHAMAEQLYKTQGSQGAQGAGESNVKDGEVVDAEYAETK